MSARKVVRVSAESDDTIRTLAERKGIDVGAAADLCVTMARRRIVALDRYAAKRGGRKTK